MGVIRGLAVILIALTSCFEVPAYEDGELACDIGRCPPGMECRSDHRCHAAGASSHDAPLVPAFDGAAAAIDGAVDGRPADAPIDAPVPDAPPPCAVGARRCAGNNLEICVDGGFVRSSPSCAQQGLECFDPAPAGGSDAYCGACLDGAQRCAGTPPVRQSCSSGAWGDQESCAAFGCYDPDGAGGAMAYCGVCANGDLRCNGGLETCAAGLWPAGIDCTATSGWSCFDPAPAGGTDAYCGLCLKDGFECHGNSRDQCNAQGTAFVVVEDCAWGCLVSSGSCCAPPSCDGRECGQSPANACGRRISCGTCPVNFICIAGTCESNQ